MILSLFFKLTIITVTVYTVMQEEMMTMKTAFEAKLRLAKEEAEASSRKHQQEILRMSAVSPYAALARVSK
jgi:hypothetical protein